MNRTLHTNDVVARVRAEIQKINTDGSLPAGVKLIPYYDRTELVDVTTATVLHNLVNGCLLIFFIQWLFLGDLRSAMIVGANIPFALFFSIIIMVLLGEDANLLSVGAIDFGIIVDAAVILVENVYRNFQARPEARRGTFDAACGGNGATIRRGRAPLAARRRGTIDCDSFSPARCKSTRQCSFPLRSLSRPLLRCLRCKGSKARFSVPWRALTPMPWWAR